MKRVITGILATALLATTLCSCMPQKSTTGSASASEGSTPAQTNTNLNETGMPIVNEKISFEIAAQTNFSKNFAELKFFQDLETETNVNIKWNMSPREGWNEKKGLLFAGELPDAFYGQGILTDVDVIKYGSQGMLIPLEDLIEKYAPNIKKLLSNETYRKELTAPDGHLYSLPSLTELSPRTHDKLFINKTWLDQLNLKAPETIDEFVAVLKAFKDNDMNGNNKKDEIPFSFLYNRKENGLFSLFGSFGQLDTLNHFIVEDKKVVYTAMTEEYKQAIMFFNKLYTEQLIDKEGFTHDFNVFTSKIKAPDKSIGSFPGWSLSSSAGENKDDYIALAPLKGADSKQIWNTYPSKINAKGSFAITNKCENPEALIRWIDTHYVPETSLQIDQGLLGITLTKTSDGRYDYLPLPEGKTFAEMIHDYSPGNNGVGGVTMEIASKLNLNANLTERAELDKFFEPYNVPDENVFPSVYFTIEEVEQISALETDIKAFVDQSYANWIVNGGIEKEWDSYLATLKNMKVDQYIAIYSGAYERYAKS